MDRVRSLTAAVALAAAAGLLSGCGPPTAAVSGEVTYDGRPVGDGYITFTPSDVKGRTPAGPSPAAAIE
jgi:hypothetical protein